MQKTQKGLNKNLFFLTFFYIFATIHDFMEKFKL